MDDIFDRFIPDMPDMGDIGDVAGEAFGAISGAMGAGEDLGVRSYDQGQYHVTVDYREWDEFFELVSPTHVHAVLHEAMNQAARDARTAMQNVIRSERLVDTGDLLNSVEISQSGGGGEGEFSVGPTVEYAVPLDVGTSGHWPPISGISGWADRHGIDPYALQQSIAMSGTAAHPYLEECMSAAERVMDHASQRFWEEVFTGRAEGFGGILGSVFNRFFGILPNLGNIKGELLSDLEE